MRKANELDLPGYPKHRSADEDIQMVMDNINRQSNSLADYEAFKRSSELSDFMSTLAKDQASSTGIYAPTDRLTGKLLNFNSQLATKRVSKDADGNNIILSQLPVSAGTVKMGFHLPIDGEKTYASITQEHKQIENIPPRFQYPYYTISEDTILDKKSYEVRDGGLFGEYLSDIGGNQASRTSNVVDVLGSVGWLNPIAKIVDSVEDGDSNEARLSNMSKRQNLQERVSEAALKPFSTGGAALSANLIYFLQLEAEFLNETKITIKPSSGSL